MMYFNVAPKGENTELKQLRVVGHCLHDEYLFRGMEISVNNRKNVVFTIRTYKGIDFDFRNFSENYMSLRDKLPIFLTDDKRNLYKAKAESVLTRINHQSQSAELVIVLEKTLTRVLALPDYVKPIIAYWQPLHVSARIARERVTRIQKPKRKKFETPAVLKRNRGKNALLRTRISNAALRS